MDGRKRQEKAERRSGAAALTRGFRAAVFSAREMHTCAGATERIAGNAGIAGIASIARIVLVAMIAWFAILAPAAKAVSPVTEGSIFVEAGTATGIDPDLLLAVALAESGASRRDILGRKTLAAPSPLAFRTALGPVFPKSLEEARRKLSEALARTDHVDIGLMQVNWHWHKRSISSPFDLLDAERNVMVGARILRRLMDACPGDAFAAIGRYNSGDPARAQRYAAHVWTIYRNIKRLARTQAANKGRPE